MIKTMTLVEVFGSGVVWLVSRERRWKSPQRPTHDSQITHKEPPRFSAWMCGEHAYYLKNQNRRADYVGAWWKVVNWDFVSDCYQKALA